MRYLLLIYSTEAPEGPPPEQAQRIFDEHTKVMADAKQKGVFRAAEPLAHVATATTVRKENGKAVVVDGPFAETKEWLAGFYMLDCENLDEAIEWAKRIPTACLGGEGCVEIRPLRWQQQPHAT